jgi:outer membrane protein assembly complex protein YaeT
MPRWLHPAGIVTLWLVLGLPSGARAQTSIYLGRPITSVHITLAGQEAQDAQIEELLVTRVGAALTTADVRETIEHLMSLGRYRDVRVHATESAGGVALSYELLPRQEITEIRFEGHLELSARQLRSAVTQRFGAAPAAGRIGEAARVLRELYADHGYFSATVTPRVIGRRDTATLQFDVEAGPRAHIAAIHIAGTPRHPEASVISGLGLQVGEPYDAPDLAARITRYTNELKSEGYYEAHLDSSTAAGESADALVLTVTVNPGPHVTLVFEGTRLPADQQDTLVPVQREGAADEDLLEDSARRIEDYFRAQGYRDASASFSRERQGDELRIVFHIRRGTLYRIASVAWTGAGSAAAPQLAANLQPRAGQPFVQARLDAMVAALELGYRERGYTDAKVVPVVQPVDAPSNDPPGGDDPPAGAVPLALRTAINPGVRTIVDDVALAGNTALSGAVLRNVLGIVPGQPFYSPTVARDRDALQALYANKGYESTTVTPQLGFSDDHSRVAIRYTITEGPQIFVEHVLISGNTRTSTALIERELRIKPGEPLSLQAMTESQRRLVALGLFRRVQVTELRHGSSTRRDVLVSVEEAPSTTIAYGGGFEVEMRPEANSETGAAVDHLEVAPRALFEITRSNLFGKNRSVSLFSRVSLRPEAASYVPGVSPADQASYNFSDYRVLGTYREPHLFGTSADAIATGVMEQGVRASFNFAHRGASAQIARRLSPALSFSANYALDRNHIYDERVSPSDQLLIDRLFPQVRLSSFSSSLVHDTRDDAINPTRGSLMVVNGQVAGRAIGSEVGFDKTFMQASYYRRLPGFPNIVFASDARMGLAAGFPRAVAETDADGQPVLGADGQPVLVEVRDLPASERFFAGGDTTVRGFALDQLGTPATIDSNGFPIGGDALVILNAELRIPLWHSLGVVGFVDAGNVFAHVSNLDLTQIRGAAGFGLRYQSPIGPIRIDLGFKLARRELAPGRLEPLTALNISLG